MSTRVAHIDDLFPDGVPIVVDWPAWEIGMSIFVPCTKPTRAKYQATEVSRRKGYVLNAHTCIEDGLFGLRIWRVA